MKRVREASKQLDTQSLVRIMILYFRFTRVYIGANVANIKWQSKLKKIKL